MDHYNTENELIESIKRGKIDAFRRSVKLYEKSIANITIGILGDSQEAENISPRGLFSHDCTEQLK